MLAQYKQSENQKTGQIWPASVFISLPTAWEQELFQTTHRSCLCRGETLCICKTAYISYNPPL